MGGLRRRLALPLFVLYSIFWTVLLLVPDPVGVVKFLLFGVDVSDRLGDYASHKDKLIHAAGYFLLVILAIGGVRRFQTPSQRAWTLLVVLAVAHGGVVELIQQLGQRRKGDLYDWLADCVGVLLAIASAWYFKSAGRSGKTLLASQD